MPVVSAFTQQRPPQEEARQPADERAAAAPNAKEGSDPEPKTAGSATLYLREPEAAALDIERTALAIARLIRTATGEFSLAVFGRWGIGKTRLMQEVAPLLTNPRAYAEALEKSLRIAARPGQESDSYKIIRFSAWQYKKPPESWVFLLESFVEAVRRLGAVERTGIMVRRLALSVGPFGMLGIMFGAAMAFGQSALIAVLLAVVAPAIGLGSLLYLLMAARSGRAQLAPALARLMRLSEHGEKLGLQAAVGADLKLLLRAWSPRGGSFEAWRSWLILLAGLLLIGGVWALGLSAGGMTKAAIQFPPLSSACKQLHERFPSLTAGPPCLKFESTGGDRSTRDDNSDAPIARRESTESDKSTGGDWAHWAMFGAWAIAGVALLWALRPWPRRVPRMLLVVDDLDRCDADEMLGQIEAVKLLIEDPVVQGRVQVVALVDEDVLRAATATKFAALAAARKLSPEILVEEHFEKLFLCHFRLRPLTVKEAGKFMDHLTAFREPPRTEPGNGWSKGTATDSGRTLAEPILTGREREALRKALPEREPSPTPRALIAYLTRYLLARSLMQLAGTSVDPDELAEELARACFKKPWSGETLEVAFGSPAWAIGQVC
jgi:hypothetical protein